MNFLPVTDLFIFRRDLRIEHSAEPEQDSADPSSFIEKCAQEIPSIRHLNVC